VLSNPLSEIGAKINRTLRSMVLAAAAGAAGVAALFFFSLGLFLWLQQSYGTINASLALGGGYSVIALVALIAILIIQRHAPERRAPATAAASAQPQWWTNPMVLTSGLQVFRILGARRIVPLALMAILAGFVFSEATSKRPDPQGPRPKPNGKGTFADARN